MKKDTEIQSEELYKDDWPLFEKMLGTMRYGKIKKYVMQDGVHCDIGCGYHGTFLKSISKQIKYGYGFDWKVTPGQEGNIELINNRGIDGIPLDDQSCDRVFMLAVLEHLEDAEAMVTECHRILKKGGILVLTTPTPIAKPILEFLSFKLHMISRASIEEHKHYYSRTEMMEIFKKCGFSKAKYRKFMFGVNSLAVVLK
ncbi:MAG: class I SAM-dependent methyltransferase [Lachnospiraceae bacterium]|nr:class I SAM-dependent methyltransferase [Lachnospiraceae bacterium]